MLLNSGFANRNARMSQRVRSSSLQSIVSLLMDELSSFSPAIWHLLKHMHSSTKTDLSRIWYYSIDILFNQMKTSLVSLLRFSIFT